MISRTSTAGTTWAAATTVYANPASGQQTYTAAYPMLVPGTSQCGASVVDGFHRVSAGEARSGAGIGPLDCAAPATTLPMPYGDLPTLAGAAGLTGEGVAGGADLSVPALGGALSAARTYRSTDARTGRSGPFGAGWH